MRTLKQFFTWWNGTTWNTRFHIWRTSKRVGEDELGNVYYLSHDGRRYVQYADQAEASAIPSGWHGWMHYRVDTPPSEEIYKARDWQKGHLPNQTGGPNAYYPKGSLRNPEDRPVVTGDYDAWTP
ncbi:MAG: NADH:ubiquinone oxidoreductase subunit NDUFA12 [Pseudomonadota bacterium]